MNRHLLISMYILLLLTSCEKKLDNTSSFEITFLTDSTFKMQVTVDEPGMLNSFITPFYKKQLEAIKIDGKINGDDFQTIRDIYEYQKAVFGINYFNAIDLSDCEIMAGGRFIYPQMSYENVEGVLITHVDSIYVQPSIDNVIPPYAFAGLWLKTIKIGRAHV